MDRSKNGYRGYRSKRGYYPNQIRYQAESSLGKIGRKGEINSSERRMIEKIIARMIGKRILKDLESVANQLLAQAKADQDLKKSETDFESLLTPKLETLNSRIKDFYYLIDALAMVRYIMVDTNFDEKQEDWFRKKYAPEINLKIEDVASVLKTLKRTLEELEKITNQDETSPISQLVNLLRSLLPDLVLAYAEFVSTHGEYNVGGLERNRWAEGKSLIGWSEKVLGTPVSKDELQKFLNHLQTYYKHEHGKYVIGFIVQLLNYLKKIGISYDDFLKLLYESKMPSPTPVGQSIIERIELAVEGWLKRQKDDLIALITEAKNQIGDGIEQADGTLGKMTFYELIQLLLQKYSQQEQETQEKDPKDAIDVLGIFLKTFWGQELPQNIQNRIRQKTQEMEHCQLIVITAEKGGHSGLYIIINLNEQSAARPSNCSFGFGGDNAQVAIVPIYGGLGKMAHEMTHSVLDVIRQCAIKQDSSGPPDEFWTLLAESGAVGNTRPKIYYELRRRIQDYRQGVLCIAQLRIIKRIIELMEQMEGTNEEELNKIIEIYEKELNQMITDTYKKYFDEMIGIGLPGKSLISEFFGPRPDGFEYVLPNLKRSGSSGSKPENNKPNGDFPLETMILNFRNHFGEGWMANEDAVAVFLATMITTITESKPIEETFDDLKNNLGKARRIIDDFRKRNLNQIGKIEVLIMPEDSVL